MRILTVPLPVFSAQSDSTPNFLPFTEPMNSTGIRYVLFGILLEEWSSENVKIRPAFQYSNDGVTWDSPIGVDLETGTPYTQAAGWTFAEEVTDLEAAVTPKLFVRFGVQVLNTATSKSQGGQIRLCVQVRPIAHGTVQSDYTKVNSQGDATETFTPIGAPILATAVTALRAAFEVIGTAGANLQVGPAFQVSYDGVTWTHTDDGAAGTFSDIGTQVRTSDGTTYPSAAGGGGWDEAVLSFRHPYIRFGIRASNLNSDTAVKAALVRLRIDWR